MEGFLQLNEKDNGKAMEYGIFGKGKYYSLTDLLHNMLSDKVHMVINDKNYDGVLSYKRLFKGFYNLFVGEENIDKILWNNVGRKINVQVRCIKEGVLDK